MKHLKVTALLGFVLVLSTLLSVSVVGAQREACLAVADAAFSGLETCSSAGASSVCFGMAAAIDGESAFTEAGSVVSLADFSSLSTAALDLDTGQWGSARMNVHANIPLSISENGLIYTILGDVEIENAVPVDGAFAPANPITVQTLVGANLRTSPNTDARVIISAPVGTQLLADGVNAAGDWLHVTFEGNAAWVSSQIVVATDGLISDLPVLGNNAQTLMQSFFLRTGLDSSPCSEQSPSMLVIQAPEGSTGSITVNGADLRFVGTIVLRNLPDNVLQLFVLDGNATNGVLSVPPGFNIILQLSEDGRSPNGAWSTLRPINDDERNWLTVLESIPPTAMYTALSIPSQADISTILTSINQFGGSGGAGCAGFQPTSPLQFFDFGESTLYWDGVENVSQYRVNVYDEFGQVIVTRTVDAFTSSAVVDTSPGGIGDGGSFAWDVEALSNGRTVCQTGKVTVLRQAGSRGAAVGASEASFNAGQSGGGNNDDDDDDDGGGGGDEDECVWGC